MRTAIVVLGRGGRRRRTDAVLRECLALVREGERLAADGVGDLVVFTGGGRAGRPSEAEQMSSAWTGPEVERVLEPTAATTAENAARTLPLLLAHEVARAVVVCSPLHVHRTRYFFSRLYAPYGIEVSIQVAAVTEGARAVAREIGAAALRRWQLRAARAELLDRKWA